MKSALWALALFLLLVGIPAAMYVIAEGVY
jgi:hypothetical protein